METENLFEIYDNVKQLSTLKKEILENYYNVDLCVKFLNLLQYHKPLFEKSIERHRYASDVILKLDWYLEPDDWTTTIFSRNRDQEFPQEIYETYSKFPWYRVRYYIAKNSFTPKEILERFVENGDEEYLVSSEAEHQLNLRKLNS